MLVLNNVLQLDRKQFSRALMCCAILISVDTAQGTTLTILPERSDLLVGFIIGYYDDGDNPGTFIPVFTGVGQGESAVPADQIPGGVTRIFSRGLNARAAGTIEFSRGDGYSSIDDASISLLPSGLWQPGTVDSKSAAGPPAPAELGVYFEGYLLDNPDDGGPPDFHALGTVNNATFSIHTGVVTETDPDSRDVGTSAFPTSLETASINILDTFGHLSFDLSEPVSTSLSDAQWGYSTTSDGVLTLSLFFDAIYDQPLPDVPVPLVLRTYASGIFQATGIVPEPSTFALAAIGAFGLVACRLRSRRASN